MRPPANRPYPATAARIAAAVAFATLATFATGQIGGPAATVLPGLAAVPKPPADLRLPGPDPRDCGTTRYAALCAKGRWSQFARMEVTLKAGAFSGTYTMERPDNGEILTTYDERTPRGRRGGEVLLLSDDAFAYRTREQLPTDDDILDYMLSAPNMAMQLVAVLLDEGVLGGPADVTGRVAIAAGSDTQYIRTESPTTAALYGPPWRVTGTIHPDDGGRLSFALRFTFRPVHRDGRLAQGRTQTIELAGHVSFAGRRPAMPDSLDLVGWKIVRGGAPLPAASTLAQARSSVGR
ncbi:MAG: hypothetical protein IPM22_01665 [Betaproteobacteria bacterium]|nr:hypothetical protein [Betaproteobacteria bacterium]